MQEYVYQTRGVCSVEIRFESDGEIVKNIRFKYGCNGNTQGVSALADGMKAVDIVKKLKGINCNGKGTSCPDQLARAVEKYVIRTDENE